MPTIPLTVTAEQYALLEQQAKRSRFSSVAAWAAATVVAIATEQAAIRELDRRKDAIRSVKK